MSYKPSDPLTVLDEELHQKISAESITIIADVIGHMLWDTDKAVDELIKAGGKVLLPEERR